MLNEKLYNKLCELTNNNVGIHKENEQLAYELRGSSNKFFKRYSATNYVYATDWGETYTVDCPICSDTRKRLVISYASGGSIKKGKTLLKVPTLIKCFNEDCVVKHSEQIFSWLDGVFTAINLQEDKVKLQKSLDVIQSLDKKELPKLFSITPEICTDSERAYIEYNRGWDFGLLNKYNCSYVKKDTVYGKVDEDIAKPPRTFFENRLLIPIIQGRVVVSWQARVLRYTDKSFKYKYIFPPACKKTSYVYNMDKALFHKNIVICEGITDVWKVGAHSIALFGKYLSSIQMNILSKLWGFDGQAVIMLDADAYPEAIKLKNKLEKYKIFPRGVGIVRIDKGDPAELSSSVLKQLEKETREKINDRSRKI